MPAVLAGSLLALAVLVTGCRDEAPEREYAEVGDRLDAAGADLEEALEELPGVATATVESEAWEVDQYDTFASVTMTVDAMPDEFGAALAVLEEGRTHFQSLEGSVVADDATEEHAAELVTVPDEARDAGTPQERAELLFRVRDLLPRAGVRVGDGVTVVVARPGRDAIAATARVVAADPIAAQGVWTFTDEDSGNYPLGAQLSSSCGLDDDVLDRWSGVDRALDALPRGDESFAAYVSCTGPGASDDGGVADPDGGWRISAHLRVAGDERADPPVRRFARLIPTVRAMLDLLRDVESGGELVVTSGTRPFLDITTDGSGAAHLDRRDWHRWAERYLAG